MNAAPMTTRPWMRRPGFAGRVDGGTVAVLALWALMVFLLPSRPGEEGLVGPSAPACMITAWPEPLADLPLALRPDLVAMPSSVSFGAGGADADPLYGVPLFLHRMESPLPPSTSGGAEDAARSRTLRERAAVLLEASRARIPDLHPVLPSGTIPVSPPRPVVLYSEGLGQTRVDTEVLRGLGVADGGRRFEAELWIAFDAAGRPSDVFLEKSSGDPAVDRELVRRMWNPASWIRAAGRGRVLVRQ